MERAERGRPIPAPPRDALELQLLTIWREVLGTPDVAVDDVFFDVGGDSLRALQLIDRVRLGTGRSLPLELLFADGTVEGAAASLRLSAIDQTPRSLVPLRPQPEGPAIFCVHSIVGTALRYVRLADLLADHYTVYAFQARALFDERYAHRSIQEMAHGYLLEVRDVQPEGPYRLAGYSMGGIVVYEMAHQLRQDGESVNVLVIDAPTYIAGFAPGSPPMKPIHTIALSLCDESILDVLDALPPEQQLEHLFDAARRRGTVPDTYRLGDLERLLSVAHTNMDALATYRLPRLDGSLHLIRTADHEDSDVALGWGELTDDVEVTKVPGKHSTLLDPPNVEAVASAVRAALNSDPRCQTR